MAKYVHISIRILFILAIRQLKQASKGSLVSIINESGKAWLYKTEDKYVIDISSQSSKESMLGSYALTPA